MEKARDVNTSKSEFVAQVFQGADLWNFVTKSTLDCVILGSVRQLVQEAAGAGGISDETVCGTSRARSRVPANWPEVMNCSTIPLCKRVFYRLMV